MMVDEASDSNKALTLSFNWSVGARCLFFAGPSKTSIKIFVSSLSHGYFLLFHQSVK